MSYITSTNVSLRLSLNPFCWEWKPFGVYESPTSIFPKRKTIGFGWLFLQVFIDIDNGEINLHNFKPIVAPWTEGIEVKEDE